MLSIIGIFGYVIVLIRLGTMKWTGIFGVCQILLVFSWVCSQCWGRAPEAGKGQKVRVTPAPPPSLGPGKTNIQSQYPGSHAIFWKGVRIFKKMTILGSDQKLHDFEIMCPKRGIRTHPPYPLSVRAWYHAQVGVQINISVRSGKWTLSTRWMKTTTIEIFRYIFNHLTSIAAHPAFRVTKCFVLGFTFPFLFFIILVI